VGFVFGVAFWKISKTISNEKNIKTYMIISGWGIFSANQAEALIVNRYPPFGLATITVLNIAAFLMLLGIYNSAVLVSANNNLRKSIYKFALDRRIGIVCCAILYIPSACTLSKCKDTWK
jgi:hypothetical protein